MILRKPYAILIKNFKLIHLILSGLMLYLLYKTYNIFIFFGEYLKTIATTISHEVTSSLFGFFPIIVSVLIIVFCLIIFALMKFKDKPVKTYVYSIVAFTLFIVYYLITFLTVKTLEINLVDVRTLKVLRDLTTVALIFESIGFIIVLIRSTGFDIKSFNFKKDLEDLNIELEDSEEFEINTEIDTSKLKRYFKKKIRHLKYAYFENKVLLNILIVFVISLIGGLIYYNKAIVNKKYNMNEMLTTSKFNFIFEESYITKYDYKNKPISDEEQLLVVRFKVKTLYGYNSIGLGAFQLDIDGFKYHNLLELKDEVLDFGKIFNDQRIKNEYQEFVLVFKVPDTMISRKMKLKYFDTFKTYVVNIKTKELNKIENVKTYNLGEEITFKESILKNTSIKIDSSLIDNNFKLEYQSCYNTCTTYYEYIVPSTNNGATKILKIDGTYTYSDSNDKINTMFKFIKTFGTIKYTNGNITKSMNIGINQVKPKRTNTTSLYLELTEEAANAEHLVLEFNIRGKIYTYSVK